jgi:anti-sigma B factor antagonist
MSLGDVQITTQDAIVIAGLSGEVDMSNAQAIGQAIERGIPHEALGLVLDLSKLDYLDSAGIQLVYQLREDLRSRAQNLTLVIPEDSPPADALRLAGVSTHLRTYQTVEEALSQRGGEGQEPD